MTQYEESHFYGVISDFCGLIEEGQGDDVLSYIFTHHPQIYDTLVDIIDDIEEEEYGEDNE